MTATKFAFYCWDKILGEKSLFDLHILGHSTLREAKAETVAEAVRNATHFLACSCLAESALLYTLGPPSQGTLFTVSWIMNQKKFHRLAHRPV